MAKTKEKPINTNILAIDHGNANIKTRQLIFPASVDVGRRKLPFCNEYIKFRGRYYALSERPQPYLRDKTANEMMLITTLFCLAKEEDKKIIDIKKPIIIAGGLPPSDSAMLNKKYENYFWHYFKDGLEFEYNGKMLSVSLDKVYMFIQDYAAIKAYSEKPGVSDKKKKVDPILKENNTFIGIDIGGMTVDYLMFINGRPERSVMGSIPLGTMRMATYISSEIAKETTLQIDRRHVMDVLEGENTVLSAEIIQEIKIMAEEWANNIINNIATLGCDLRTYPEVFFGGGSLTLKEYLRNSPILSDKISFVTDIHANAEGYYYLAKEWQKVR